MDAITIGNLKREDMSFNDDVAQGLAVKEVRLVAEFLDRILATSHKSVEHPEFKYLGYRKLNPFEEFNSEINKLDGTLKASSVPADTTISDVVRYRFTFSFEGELMTRDLFLPHIGLDSTMRISDVRYYVAPVLTDNIISPYKDHIFVKYFVDKIRVVSKEYSLLKNDIEITARIPYVENLYKLKAVTNINFGAITPLALFTLVKYGLGNKFGNSDVMIVDKGDLKDYKNDNFIIYSSTGRQLPEMKLIEPVRHNWTIVIPANAGEYVRLLAVSILYAFDALPVLATQYADVRPSERIEFFKVLLARIQFKDTFSASGMVPSLEEHLRVLDTYTDEVIREMFAMMGLDIKDFYDFIFNVIDNYSYYKKKGLSNDSTIEDKHIEILYYLVYDIIEGFNKCFSGINKQIKNGNGTYNAVFKTLNGKAIRLKTIFQVVKSKKKALPITPAITSGDCKVRYITSAEIQERGLGAKEGSNTEASKFPTVIRQLRGMHLYYSMLLYLGKTAPTPLLRINLFARFKNKKICPPEDLVDTIKEIDRILTSRANDLDSGMIASAMDATEGGDAVEL